MSQTEHWFNKTACSSRSRGSSSTTGHQIHDQSPHVFLAEVPIHAVGNARPAPTGSISMIGASHHPYRHAHPLCDLEAAVRHPYGCLKVTAGWKVYLAGTFLKLKYHPSAHLASVTRTSEKTPSSLSLPLTIDCRVTLSSHARS